MVSRPNRKAILALGALVVALASFLAWRSRDYLADEFHLFRLN